jgi:uncharacterized protein
LEISAFLPHGVSQGSALALVAASFFTSGITAALGVGGGVILLALMSYVLPVIALIPVHGVAQTGSNIGRMFVQRNFIVWHSVLPFLAGSAIGAIAGAGVVVQLPEMALKIMLGVFIVIVSWLEFPALKKARAGTLALGGAGTTFATMFLGATGPLAAIFFSSAFSDRRNVIANHATAMTFQHGMKIVVFGFAGFAFVAWLPLLAAIITMGYLGTLAGSRLLWAMPEARFRVMLKWALTLIGIDLIRRGLLLH